MKGFRFMDEKRIALAKYRFSKAMEELSVAELSLSLEKYSNSLSNSYYAMFHAVRVLLALEGVDSKKHSGVIHLFSQLFVNTKLLSKDLSKLLVEAFEIRVDSDYKDFFVISKDDCVKQFENTKIFIEKIKSFIKDHYEIEL